MIDAVNATTSSSAAAAAMKKATGLNKDDFLKLFITQMKNQDPLSPMDSSEFLGQLAQLTQVEQAYNTNSNLQSMMQQQNTTNSLAAVSFIGKAVEATGNEFRLSDGATAKLTFSLPAAANDVSVLVKDAAGSTVRTLNAGRFPGGTSTVTWDGKDRNGNPVAAGNYQFEVAGKGADGTALTGTPLINGTVEGVSLEGNSPVLTIGGINVALADVRTVRR
jgi:flagellar basal-body rod modification protein FlgD